MRRVSPTALALFLAAALTACSKPPGAPAPPPAQPPAPAPASPAAPQGAARYAIVAAESSASYIAREKFVNRPLPNEAVGTTTAIKGELVVGADGQFHPSQVTVDLRTLQSDSSRRDNALRGRWLESDKYPLAEFSISGVAGAAPKLAEGQPVPFKLAGKLKVHGTEKAVTWEATGTRGGDTLKLEASIALKMSDFGIEPPDIAGMLKAEDALRLQVKLVARKQ